MQVSGAEGRVMWNIMSNKMTKVARRWTSKTRKKEGFSILEEELIEMPYRKLGAFVFAVHLESYVKNTKQVLIVAQR